MAPRILVADDSVTIQKVVELTFSKENVTLLQARSGEDAIRKAKEDRPDLILLDLVMPDKNGYEICAALRAEPMLKAVPIILLTGTFEAFDRDRAVQVGANDFVTKPFESQQLISKVRQQLFSRTVDTGLPAPPPLPPKAAVPPSAPKAAAAPVAAVPSVSHEPREAPPREAVRRPVPPRPAPEPPAAAAMPPRTTRLAERAAPPIPPARIPAPTPSPLGMAAAAATVAGSPGSPEPPSAPRPEPVREVQAPRPDAVPERPAPAKPAPPVGSGPMELRLEDLAHLDNRVPAAAPEPLALDDLLGPAEPAAAAGPQLEVEPVALASAPAIPAPPEAPPSGTLGAPSQGAALEDLLASPPTAAGLAARADQAASEPAPEVPVFELSADMGGPGLPMIEVGTGEPPTLSVEDLIGVEGPKSEPPPEQVPFAPVGLGMEPPSSRVPKVDAAFDLSADAGGPALPMIEVGKGEPPALSVEELMSGVGAALVEVPPPAGPELELELPAVSPEASAPATPPPPAEPAFELEPAFDATPPGTQPQLVELPGIERMEPPATDAERPAVEPSPPPPLPGLETESLFEPVVSAPAPQPAQAAAVAGGPGLGVEEMASMRDAVTERVARELARDLSDKLVERIERIVWEVVPEMAEILIAKEIERIRAMADGKSIS